MALEQGTRMSVLSVFSMFKNFMCVCLPKMKDSPAMISRHTVSSTGDRGHLHPNHLLPFSSAILLQLAGSQAAAVPAPGGGVGSGVLARVAPRLPAMLPAWSGSVVHGEGRKQLIRVLNVTDLGAESTMRKHDLHFTCYPR